MRSITTGEFGAYPEYDQKRTDTGDATSESPIALNMPMLSQQPGFNLVSGDLPEPQVPDDTVLWRYLSLDKALSFVQSSSIWFTSIRLLPDWAEASVPHFALEQIRMSCKRECKPDEETELIVSSWKWMEEAGKHLIFLSSWTNLREESEALWHMYASENGLAIRTTAGKLRRCLPEHVMLSRVQYLDPRTTTVSIGSIFNIALWKRVHFEYEAEVRALWGSLNDVELHGQPGFACPISVTDLADKIVISPHSPSWLENSVKSLIRQTYPSVPVESSSMRKPN